MDQPVSIERIGGDHLVKVNIQSGGPARVDRAVECLARLYWRLAVFTHNRFILGFPAIDGYIRLQLKTPQENFRLIAIKLVKRFLQVNESDITIRTCYIRPDFNFHMVQIKEK
jgi:hypothetical protein